MNMYFFLQIKFIFNTLDRNILVIFNYYNTIFYYIYIYIYIYVCIYTGIQYTGIKFNKKYI